MIDEIKITIFRTGGRSWWENGIYNSNKSIIAEIDFDNLVPIKGLTTRKLKAIWSPELTQDLQSYLSIK